MPLDGADVINVLGTEIAGVRRVLISPCASFLLFWPFAWLRICCSCQHHRPRFCARRASSAFSRRANVCRSLRTHTLRTPVGETN